MKDPGILKGYKAPTTAKLLREEGLQCSRVGIVKFIKKFQDTGNIWSQAVSWKADSPGRQNNSCAASLHPYWQGLLYLPENNTSPLNVSWMDGSRKCLLPAYPWNKLKQTHDSLFDQLIWTNEWSIVMKIYAPHKYGLLNVYDSLPLLCILHLLILE